MSHSDENTLQRKADEIERSILKRGTGIFTLLAAWHANVQCESSHNCSS